VADYVMRIKRIYAPTNALDLGQLKMDFGKFIVAKQGVELQLYAWNTTSCRDVARRFGIDVPAIIGGGNAVYESGISNSFLLSPESRQAPPYVGRVPYPVLEAFRVKLERYFKSSKREVVLLSQESPEDHQVLEALLGSGYNIL
jgi:hypothetical protein